MKHSYQIRITESDLLTHQLERDLQRLLSDEYEASAAPGLVKRCPAQIPSYDLIKWMELAAACASQDELEPGQIARGHTLRFRPKAEAGLGDTVSISVEIVDRNRRFFSYRIIASRGDVVIAEMDHQRFIFNLPNA